MKRIMIIAAALAVAACGPADQSRPWKEQVEDVRTETHALGEVRALLRDPGSAQFSDVRLSTSGAVCGRVNARNGFGGMTGSQRFISGPVTALEDQMGPGEMDQAWSALC